MVDTSDPPRHDRKRSAIWKKAKAIGRNLVSRQTFLFSLRLISLIIRLAKLWDWP